MASINRSRQTAYPELAEDDPFAELTRIMARDSRALADSDAANDAMGIDLEAELLGNLSNFERRPADTVEVVEADDSLSDDYVADAMDAEFEAAFGEGWSVEETDAPEMASAPAVEDVSWQAAAGETASIEGEMDEQGGPSDFAADTITNVSDSVEDKINLFDRIAAELREGAPRPVADEFDNDPEDDLQVSPQTSPLEDAPDLEDARDHYVMDEPVSWKSESMIWSDDREADAATVSESAGETQPEAEPDVDEVALAADLEASLALDDMMLDGEAAEDDTAADAAEPFDYRIAAVDRHDYLDNAYEETTAEVAADPIAADEEMVVAAPEVSWSPWEEPAPASQHGDSTNGIFTAPFWSVAARQQSVAQTQAGPAEAAAPHAATQAYVPAPEVAAADASQSSHDEAFTPDVETIDIEERATAVKDDLDIPEPEMPSETTGDAEFDDLAAELAGAFGEITDEALTEPAMAPSPAAVSYVGESQPAMQVTGIASPNEHPFELETAIASPGFESGFEAQGRSNYNTWAGGMEEEQIPAEQYVPSRRAQWSIGRSGAIGAAALAAVVLLGGVSLFALSSGGGGLGQPALVKASDEPFKVKPKNAGGSKVADDNSEVYQRASGNVADVPAQKTLMTSAEAPVDLSARIVDASAMAPLDEEVSGLSNEDGTSKSQARLTPAPDGASEAAEPGPITVQAHRVKTFIVKPDGTLVARENPPETQTAGEDVPEAAGSNSSGVDNGEDAVAALAQPSDAAGTIDATPTGSAKADAAPARSAPAPEGEPKPARVASAQAPEKPLAPVTSQASSEWSVQIASQPTADSAQQSYQRMAQRYGDLLTGRGVNIVKADISGKGTYYRVRIPSSSKDDAVQLCSKLKSAGGSCFVSK